MNKGRLEAFSDGVLAIIITIMILEMKAPTGTTLSSLSKEWPLFIGYVLSYAFVGIYWINHHRILVKANCINGRVLWANLFWMFCISFIPFTTAWAAETDFAKIPSVIYSFNVWMSAISYHLLAYSVLSSNHENCTFHGVMFMNRRNMFTFVLYTFAIVIAYITPLFAYAIHFINAIIWILPNMQEVDAQE